VVASHISVVSNVDIVSDLEMQNKQLGYKIARVHPSYFIQNVLEVI
jgi:hypothetical protein